MSAPLELSRSRELLRRGAAVDATLACEGYVLPRDRLVDGEYPIFGSRASGSRVWDVDGNEYLDFILAYGTVILGHADPMVSEAVIREIRDGFAISVRKQVQVELGELLTELIPNAERVILLKTGSDATSAAVRISRAVTGRNRVIRWGYNGWHDWAAIRPAGVPLEASTAVDTFRYNDIDDLRRQFERHPGEVACLLMMPFEIEAPADGFLQAACDLAHEHGALFVLDEMRSGFRMAPGGAQEFYGVQADLATFSKAMANGYPISAVVGPERIMQAMNEIHIGSSFYINGAEMAAAVATISQVRDGVLLEHVHKLGQRFLSGLAAQIDQSGVRATVLGLPPMPFMRFTHPDAQVNQLMLEAFYTQTIRHGVLLHPNHHWYVCTAMTETDIDTALTATLAGFTAASAIDTTAA